MPIAVPSRALQKPSAGACVNWGHPLTRALVFACLMNNASMLAEIDLVTGKKSGSFSGSNAIASRLVGQRGEALKTTNGNYVSFGATVPAWSSFTAMTVSSLAFCSNAAGANDEFLMSNYGLFSSNSWIIYNPGGGNYYGAYLNDAFSIYGPDPGAGKWMRVTWTWDGTTVRLFHDAIQVNSGAYSPSAFSNGYIQIGGRNATPSIADAFLWRRAITPREVAQLVVSPYEMLDPLMVVQAQLPSAATGIAFGQVGKAFNGGPFVGSIR